MSKAKQVALKGTIGWDKKNGHQLKGTFRDLFMLRASRDFEFFGFRDRMCFYVTNGAPKRTGRRGQEPDYRLALRIRTEFFVALERS